MKSEARPFRAAIVGAGLMGRWHAHFAEKAGAIITAIVDSNLEIAHLLQRKFRAASVWPSLEQCFNRTQVDVVHLCTPTLSHFSLAKLALENNAHVLVEKPASGSTIEAEELVVLARKRGLKIIPAHQFPFQNGFRELSRNKHLLGQPVRVSLDVYSAGGNGLSEAERKTRLLEITPHAVSLFIAVLGPEAVHCLRIMLPQTPDRLMLEGVYQNAALHAFFSLRGRPTRNWLTYVGTAGTAHLDLYHGYCLWEAGKVSRRSKLLRPLRFGINLLSAAGSNLVRRVVNADWAYPGLGQLITRFYQSMREGSAAPISETELLETVRLIDEARVEGTCESDR